MRPSILLGMGFSRGTDLVVLAAGIAAVIGSVDFGSSWLAASVQYYNVSLCTPHMAISDPRHFLHQGMGCR